MLTIFKKLTNGNLEISLTDEGREEIADNPNIDLCDLIEDQLCNGWRLLNEIDLANIGFLTSNPYILTDNYEYKYDDENDEIGSCDYVYHYNYYAIYDIIKQLRSYGKVELDLFICRRRDNE